MATLDDTQWEELRKANPNLVNDLSQRAIEIGRLLDRLPPGRHIIELTKDEVRAKAWCVEVSTVQHSRSITLPKKIT
jgi:hypothetical protein